MWGINKHFQHATKIGERISRKGKPKTVSQINVESMSKDSDDESSDESDLCGECIVEISSTDKTLQCDLWFCFT